MLRQLRDALRFAIADFFDVPAWGVTIMLAVIALLIVLAYVRTTTTMSETGGLPMLLGGSVLILLYAGDRFFRRR